MSIARGPVDTFGTLTGGFGGAISVGMGIRYKRVLERNSNTKIASVRRAFGSHGKIIVDINASTFNSNYAWNSGGAINALGGRTVSKNSILKIKITDSSFIEIKVWITEITNVTN